VLDAHRVRAVALDAGAGHRITVEGADGTRQVTARWVVDAAGRAGLLKRQLGLVRPSTHAANASWWRFRSRIKIDDWSNDPAWKARVASGLRWHSTVHLMGVGYWFWLIPLGSGSHSFGIVADAELHPFSRINRFERALDWLHEFEPQAAVVMEAHAAELEDFLALQHFAHGCARVFSPDRWSLVGEAGVFTDPFYSPGSDFIAMGNDYTTDLIVRDARGENVGERADAFNAMYLRLFDAFIRLYDGHYPTMGNAQVMTAKISWDNSTYWSVTALLFFQRRLVRPEFIASIDPLLRRYFLLHARMQQFFTAWNRADAGAQYESAWLNIVGVNLMRTWQAALAEPLADDETVRARLETNFQHLQALARTWQAVALERHPNLRRAIDDDGGPLVDIRPLRLTPVGVPV
jgi:hypothetical protein